MWTSWTPAVRFNDLFFLFLIFKEERPCFSSLRWIHCVLLSVSQVPRRPKQEEGQEEVCIIHPTDLLQVCLPPPPTVSDIAEWTRRWRCKMIILSVINNNNNNNEVTFVCIAVFTETLSEMHYM